MEPFADYTDVESIWRPLTGAEIVVVVSRIAQASRMVRREFPNIDARIAAGSITADDVRDVVAEMVLRLVSMPAYTKQQSVTVDDASKSVTYAASVSEGVMFIADRERQALSGSAAKSRAFTIYPGAGQPWTC